MLRPRRSGVSRLGGPSLALVSSTVLIACASPGSDIEEPELMAAAACMMFVDVYVNTASGDLDVGTGVMRVREARDMAAAAAALDRRYKTLADDLAAMYAAMGVSDSALRLALADVHADCEPLID